MTDFYSSQYENAGPIARPVIQRSQYLADALRAMQASGQHISSYGELGTRLLADALLQYQQHRQEARLRNATEKDAAALNQPLLDQLALIQGGGSQPAAAGPTNEPTPPGGWHLAPNPQALSMALSGDGSVPTAGIGQGAGVGAPGLPPMSNRAAKTHDALTRLLIGEDNNPRGQQAVANVVLNRANTGMDPADVITQPHQFEPYGNQQTWARLNQIPTTDPRYQQAEQALAAAQQQDITGGAMNFFGPQSQAAMGRQPPAFAQQGGGQMIGGNQFFQGQFAPPADYQPPPPPQQTGPVGGPPPPPADALPPAGAPPAAPAPSTNGAAGGQPNQWGLPPAVTPQAPQQAPPAINGMASIAPQELQFIQSQIQSSDPRVQAQGRALLQTALQRAMQVPGYHTQLNHDGSQVIYIPDNPSVGQPFTRPVPGFTPDIVAGPSINGLPTSYTQGHADQLRVGAVPPQAMTHPAQSGEMQGITPGSAVDVSPTGERRLVEPTHQGYQRTPTGEAPLPGGSADITAPQNAIPVLTGIQAHVAPLLDQARALNQNISSVRVGVQQHNGIGDLAIANGFQHLLDSGIVRQEDMNTQAQAAGLQGDVTRWMQYVQGGGRLDDAHRAAFGRMAELLYTPRMHNLQTQVEAYRPLVDRLGAGSYDLIVPPAIRQEFGWEAQPGQLDAMHRLQNQTREIFDHARQAPHRRVLGVTQVGP